LPGWRLDPGVYKTFNFSDNEKVPRFRFGITSINIFNHPVKVADFLAPFTINANPGVAIADDCGYDNGSVAELCDARQIRFELQVLF
jgi:hypothetical protein